MGDRGNVFFVDGGSAKQLEGIYMYTHWTGSVLPATVRAALVRGRGRWGDSQYLARIIFCELVAESVMEETGFGLSTRMGDNGQYIVRVDDNTQRVSFHDQGKERNPRDKGIASWTYDAFVAAGDRALLAAFTPPSEDEEKDPPAALPKAKAKAKAKPKKAKKPSKPKPKAKSRRT